MVNCQRVWILVHDHPILLCAKDHRLGPTHHQDFEAIIFGRELIWSLQSGTVYLLPTCDQHVQFPGS